MASDWMIKRMNERRTSTGAPPLVPTPIPTQTVSPKPVQTGYNPINTFKSNVATAGRKVTAGLGKAADILSRPLQFVGSGGKAGERARVEGKSYVGQAKAAFSGGMRGLTGKETTTPGQYVSEDVLKIKNPIAKAGVQLATDLVADPLNVLGVLGKAKSVKTLASPFLKAGKAIKESAPVAKAVEFAKKTPVIYKPIEAVADPYFRNPAAGKIVRETQDVIRQRIATLYRHVDESSKGLSSSEKVRIGQLLEGGISTGKTDKKLVSIADQFKKVAEDVGQEAVNTGLMTPEQFATYKGKYMPHIWQTVTGEGVGAGSSIPSIAGSQFKHRKGAEGFVKEFQAPVFKGIGTEMKDIEAAKMYGRLGQEFGSTPTTAAEASNLADKGYKLATDVTKSRGGEVLNNKLLPPEIIDYIKRSQKTQRSWVGGAYDKLMGAWKAGKTIYNPAYHVRNMISNQILSDLQTGKGLMRTVLDYAKATSKYMGKGDQKYVREAQDVGLIKTPHFGEAVDDLLNHKFTKSVWRKLAEAPQEFQRFSEETAKLNVFTEFRRRGLSVQDAMKKAEEAIFSPYRINAAERSTLGRAIPFYSFTRQAAPFIGKKLVKNPERFTKYVKGERAMQTASGNPDEKLLPDYMKGMVATPLKNKEKQPYYFNPQYIYPWGNFLQEGNALPLGYSVHPAIQEYAAQATGVDPYFKSEFVRESMSKGEQTKARLNHLATTILPSAYRSIQGKIAPAVQGRPDYQGRERSLPVTLAGELAGMKLYPFDKAGAQKSLSSQKYIIQKDATSEVNRVLRDRSLTPQERSQKIKDIRARMQERLQELQ